MRLTALLVALWPGLAGAQDVWVLGEVHDNPAHHLRQADIVRDVAPAALVFEMLSRDQAAAAADANRTDEAALGAALGWNESGWPPFAEYWPIFAAAPQATLFGAAVARPDIARAMEAGAADAFGEDAAAYGLGPLDPEVAAERAAEQSVAHCGALPKEMLPGMVEAQRLRDAAFARAVAQAHDETGGPVVLITGNGHARTDRGVPAILARIRPDLDVRAVALVEGDADDARFDDVIATGPVEREDPCAAFE